MFFFIIFGLLLKYGHKIIFRFLLCKPKTVRSVHILRIYGNTPIIRLFDNCLNLLHNRVF